MTPYLEIPVEGVDVGRQAFAEFVAQLSAGELRFPRPRVRWFLRAKAPEGWGWTSWEDDRELDGQAYHDRPGEIWVADGLTRARLAEVVAHECHHAAWHHRNGSGWYGERERQVMEQAADAFAASLVKRWRF